MYGTMLVKKSDLVTHYFGQTIAPPHFFFQHPIHNRSTRLFPYTQQQAFGACGGHIKQRHSLFILRNTFLFLHSQHGHRCQPYQHICCGNILMYPHDLSHVAEFSLDRILEWRLPYTLSSLYQRMPAIHSLELLKDPGIGLQPADPSIP